MIWDRFNLVHHLNTETQETDLRGQNLPVSNVTQCGEDIRHWLMYSVCSATLKGSNPGRL